MVMPRRCSRGSRASSCVARFSIAFVTLQQRETGWLYAEGKGMPQGVCTISDFCASSCDAQFSIAFVTLQKGS